MRITVKVYLCVSNVDGECTGCPCPAAGRRAAGDASVWRGHSQFQSVPAGQAGGA